MSDKTGIEWTDATWNPTTGCDQVSPGCDNCYALDMAARLKKMGSPAYQEDGDPRTSGPGFKLTLHPDRLDQPLRWKRPRRIFVNSMSDLFHPDVPDQFIAEVFAVMAVGHQHIFQVLTKRPQRMAQILSDGYVQSQRSDYRDHVVSPSGRASAGNPMDYRTWREAFASLAHRWAIDRTNAGYLSDRLAAGMVPSNVWLGTSIESDRYAFRANYLRETPAAVRFLSLEPLLGPLPSLDLTGIDWVIVGGESGAKARPMHRGWVRDIRDRCQEVGVAFFYKQAGQWASYTDGELHADRLSDGLPEMVMDRDGRVLTADDPCAADLEPTLFLRVGKKVAGRELDGRTWDEMPE